MKKKFEVVVNKKFQQKPKISGTKLPAQKFNKKSFRKARRNPNFEKNHFFGTKHTKNADRQ